MAGIIVGVETNEIAIKDSEEDFATDGKDPDIDRSVTRYCGADWGPT